MLVILRSGVGNLNGTHLTGLQQQAGQSGMVVRVRVTELS
jgi:hypothetical protein